MKVEFRGNWVRGVVIVICCFFFLFFFFFLVRVRGLEVERGLMLFFGGGGGLT